MLKSKLSTIVLALLACLPFVIVPLSTSASTIAKPANHLGLRNGLVGHWTFDGKDMIQNVADVSGNGNNGYLQGFTSTTTAPGKLGQALKFDGVNDYVNLGAAGGDLLEAAERFSVSLWFKPNSGLAKWPTLAGLISKDINAYSFAIRKHNNTNMSFMIKDNNLLIPFVPAANQWYFVTATFDSSEGRKFYVNGAYSIGDGYVTPVSSSNDRLLIGLDYSPADTRYFPGTIDDVRIYNRALSAEEVKALYNMGGSKMAVTPDARGNLASGLVGHWTFDGKDTIGGTIWDVSGNGNHGHAVNIATSTFYAPGKLGQGLNFDGVNDYVNISGITQLSNDTFTVSGWLKREGNSATGAHALLGFAVSGGTDERFRLSMRDSDGHVQYNSDFGVAVSVPGGKLHDWTFLTATYDYTNQVARLYIDGNYAGSDTSFSQSSDVVGRMEIGQRVGTNYTNGLLDDVRIYNRVLSAEEVKALYNMGESKMAVTPDARGNLASGLVGHWTFDGKDMIQNVADVSGNGNNGYLVGFTSTTTAPGKLGQGLRFDGSNDFIKVPTDFALDQVSVSVWVFHPPSTEIHYIFNKFLSVNDGWGLRFFSNSLDIYDDIDAADDILYSAAISTDKWHHIVVTIGNSFENRLYVDGSLIGSGINSTASLDSFPSYLYIGARRDTAQYPFRGTLDDVRIYNRALSAEEVKVLYNLGR